MRRLLPLLTLSALGLGCTNAHLRAGRAALASGRYRLARERFQRARLELPEESAPGRGLAAAHRALAAQANAEGRCEEARTALAHAEAFTPPVLADHQALFECAARRGLPAEEQITSLRQLVALGDHRARVLRTLMHLELAAGDLEQAVSRVGPLERRFALSHRDRVAVGRALLDLGRDAEALPQLLRVVQADPTDPLHRLKVAELRERLGQPTQARQAYRALALDFPDNPVVFLRLAAFLRRAGAAGEARAMQRHADRLRGLRRQRRRLRSLPPSRR